MNNPPHTKAQLQAQAEVLRQRVAELEAVDAQGQQAQVGLQVSEARYRRLFETAQDGILILDADTGQITDVNPFLVKMLGYSHAEFLGKRLWEISPFKDKAAAQTAFAELQSAGYIRYEDLPLEASDGRHLNVEFVSNVYRVDRQCVIQCNIRDISDRKQREHELAIIALTASALRTAATRAAMLPIIVHQASCLLQADTATLVTLDPITDEARVVFEPSLSTDRTVSRLPSGASIIRQVITTNQPYLNNAAGQEPPNLPGDGQAIAWVPLSVHDQTIGALGIGRQNAVTDEEVRLLAALGDIAASALQRVEVLETLEQRVAARIRELAIANERLQELDRLKSKFVSDVSHELRTPVTSLSLYVDLLQYGKPEKREFYLAQLKQQMARLRALINEILDLEHLERDHREVSLTQIDLNSIVEHVVATQQTAAEAAGLQLIDEVAKHTAFVMARPEQLSRAVTNLVANAIKYTRAGTVWARTSDTDGWVCLTITDTGIGIAPEDVALVFDRFYRGKQVAQLNIAGTGLGLAIVKEIVEAHGGTVDLESTLGVGTTVKVRLPAIVDSAIDQDR